MRGRLILSMITFPERVVKRKCDAEGMRLFLPETLQELDILFDLLGWYLDNHVEALE